MKVKIIKGSIGKEYIHMIVSCPPNLSVSKLVQQLKIKTSKTLLSEYEDLRKMYEIKYLWASGYFCQSIGVVKKKMIKKYIENEQDENTITIEECY